MNIGSLLYFISGVLFLGIFYIFHKAIDGILRKVMMSMFLTVGIGMFLRGCYFLLPLNFRIEFLDFINFIISIPILISSMFGFFFLYYKFYVKENKNISQEINNQINKNKGINNGK